MSYKYSSLDKTNLRWFPKNNSCQTLRTIHVRVGSIRGLHNIQLNFEYPITAIAGKNGSCKTTVLALAACAFHNKTDGFKLAGEKKTYYTFSDFFIQTKEETTPEGILIRYQILHDNWAGIEAGAGWQHRRKKRGGRWNNYDSRVRRTVVFLGVERIVPHSERSVSKSYRAKFKQGESREWENSVRQTVGRVLDTDYTTLSYKKHSKYRLPIVSKNNQNIYSGFNMGAGEHSLFELFAIINECPNGTLILIDEIELGLHERAQEKLIEELKKTCKQRNFQIICTSHSPRILESLPPEGRIFLERVGNDIHAIPGISPAYATGKLSGRKNTELDILVEDEAAKMVLEAILEQKFRRRVNIMPIGSASAVMRHLSARYKEIQHTNKPTEVCVILDGDKSSAVSKCLKDFSHALESKEQNEHSKTWAERRLSFLPGNSWPETWVLSVKNRQPFYNAFEKEQGMSSSEVDEMLDTAARAGKHNEFFEASEVLALTSDATARLLIKCAVDSEPQESERVQNFIRGFIDKEKLEQEEHNKSKSP